MKIKIFKVIFLLLLICSTAHGEEKKIIVRGDNHFPPFEYINEKGEPDGFDTEIIRAIMKAENLDYSLEYGDWGVLIKEFPENKFDVVVGATNNQDWNKDALFGVPYYEIKIALVSNKKNRYTSISDLKGKKVAVLKGSWSYRIIKENNITDSIIAISNIYSALDMLSQGKCDAILNSEISTKYAINKGKYKNLTAVSFNHRNEDYSFVVTNLNHDLLYKMNRGLNTIKLDGTYDKIYKKWFSHYSDSWDIYYLKWIIISLVFLALILTIVVLVYNRKSHTLSKRLKESKLSLKDKNILLEAALSAGDIIPLYWVLNTDMLFTTSAIAHRNYDYFNNSENYSTLEAFLDRIHPDERDDVALLFSQIRNGEKESVIKVIRFDSRKIFDKYFSLHLNANKKDENGKVERATGYMQDISKRQMAVNTLRQNEALMTTILNAIPFPIHVTDVNHNFIFKYWNQQSTIEYGDLKGKSFSDVMSEEQADKIFATDKKVFYTGTIYFNHETLTTNDGKTHHTLVKKSLIYIEGEKMVLSVRWNIGHIKELEKGLDIAMRELENAKNRAIQSDKLKSAFLANMSHEIRTPLNSIVGFSQLLATEEDPQEKKKYIDIISSNSENLLRLINDVLDLSKIEAGFIDFKKTEFDLSKLFNVLDITFKKRMKEGVNFICVKPYNSCIINADKNRLTQIISNFVTNSIKFTQTGSITLKYELLSSDRVKIAVTDTGSGIPEDKKDRIFERFEKLNDTAQGTGLGLSICKSIIENINGDIGYESKLGQGSTFWITFPTNTSVS